MILQQLFIFTAIVSLIIILLHLVGVGVYDFRQVRRQRRLRLHPYARPYRHRPLVSVIIPTHNAARVIERCLQGLLGSSYRKLEVIIIDNASHDDTKAIVKQFQTTYPKKSISLIARRTAEHEYHATMSFAKKYAHGELVLWFDAAGVVDKQAVSTAVQHLNLEPGTDIVAFNQQVGSAFNTIGLLQKYSGLLRNRSKKLASVCNALPSSAPEYALYRRDALFAARKLAHGRNSHYRSNTLPFAQRSLRFHYASDAIVYTLPPSSVYKLLQQQYRLQLSGAQAFGRTSKSLVRTTNYSVLLRALRALVIFLISATAVCIPILLGYAMYMAINLHEPKLLISSGALLSVLLLVAIWGEEQVSLHQKVGYILGIPLTYGWFSLLSMVRLAVVVTALLREAKKLVGLLLRPSYRRFSRV